MSSPLNLTDPVSELVIPVIRSNVVDFPAPLGPINPVIDPFSIEKLTLSTAESPPNFLPIFSTFNGYFFADFFFRLCFFFVLELLMRLSSPLFL